MTLVYLDTETTGLDPARHHVWEIAYAVDDGPILSTRVHVPILGAHPKALMMNGYFDRMTTLNVYAAFEFEANLIDALKGATLVGANPAFDAAFLHARWGEAPWKYRLLDIESYAMPYLGLNEPVGLQKIAQKLNVSPGDAHTAAGDVHTLRQCHRVLRSYYEDNL